MITLNCKRAIMDPAIKTAFMGLGGTVGFVLAWYSDNGNVGKRAQEIKKIEEGKRIDFELCFIKPFESTAQAYMVKEPLLKLKSKCRGFQGNMAYPLIVKLFMDPEKSFGDDFSTGLNNLKTILKRNKFLKNRF